MLVQAGVSDAPARAVAREIGGRVVAVDPLAYDVPAALRAFAAAVTGDAEGTAPSTASPLLTGTPEETR